MVDNVVTDTTKQRPSDCSHATATYDNSSSSKFVRLVYNSMAGITTIYLYNSTLDLQKYFNTSLLIVNYVFVFYQRETILLFLRARNKFRTNKTDQNSRMEQQNRWYIKVILSRKCSNFNEKKSDIKIRKLTPIGNQIPALTQSFEQKWSSYASPITPFTKAPIIFILKRRGLGFDVLLCFFLRKRKMFISISEATENPYNIYLEICLLK